MSYREKPSDAPYKATRWIDVINHLVRELHLFEVLFGIAIVGTVFGGLLWLISNEPDPSEELMCDQICYPADSRPLHGGECWCVPEEGPPRLGGSWQR